MPRCRLELPDRLAAGPATSEQACRRRLGCRPPHLHRFLRGLCSIGICEELPDGAFALDAGEANRCARARPPGLPRKSRSWSGNIGGLGRMSSSNLKTGKPGLRADLRHARLRLARASTPSKARCSTPISPRRRWRRPSPSSLCSICRARRRRRYWRRLWRAARRLARRPSADRSGVVRPAAHHRSRQALPANRSASRRA